MYKCILMGQYIIRGGFCTNMSILNLMTTILKSYIDKTISRETLNRELLEHKSKLLEYRSYWLSEESLYVSIIHWIATAPPNIAYNDEEIEHVYKALIGEDGYCLNYSSLIFNDKYTLNSVEQRILEISKNYVDNYNNNTKFHVLNNQNSYLEEDDRKFISSLYSNKLARTEFREAKGIHHEIIHCLFHLLDSEIVCNQGCDFDIDGLVAKKINVLLSLCKEDLPVYCIKSYQNGRSNMVIL